MDNDFTTQIKVDASPRQVFEAVQGVRGWWSETITGETNELNDEFEFEVKDIHYSKQKLTEVIPDELIEWTVLDAHMTFIKNPEEWKGTKIRFEITAGNDGTVLTFTHHGLTEGAECYMACAPAWTQYIEHSLRQRIETGVGDPNLEGRTINKPTTS